MSGQTRRGRRTRAGGAKKRPTRYGNALASEALACALRAHRKGRLEEASQLYREVIAKESAALEAALNLGAASIILGRAREAMDAYALATKWAGDDARALRDMGIGLAAIGQFDLAIASLRAAVARDGALIGAKLALIRACAENGQSSEALAHASELARSAPDDPSVWLELHRASFDDRDPKACVEAAARAFALDSNDAQACLLYAGALALERQPYEHLLSSVIQPELASALQLAIASSRQGARVFSTKRATLEFAVDHAITTGPIVEFGVRHGTSTRVLAAKHVGPIHAFDSFVGLPEEWQKRSPGAFSTQGELPLVPSHVVLHVGTFESTLPKFVNMIDESPRLVHVDSDLYSSAKTVLDMLGPRLSRGCVLVFDEYIGNPSWRHDEYRAMTEAIDKYGWHVQTLSISWITGQTVLRLD